MSKSGRRRRLLKVLSRLDVSMLDGDGVTIQLTSSTVEEMLGDAAPADKTLL